METPFRKPTSIAKTPPRAPTLRIIKRWDFSHREGHSLVSAMAHVFLESKSKVDPMVP